MSTNTMKVITTKPTILYGLAYQPLQTQLTKQRKFGELRLSSYLAARIGIDTWTFSAPDIIEQTGLSRQTVYRLCQELELTGIFKIVKIINRAAVYAFDATKLLAYLQGDCALDGLAKIENMQKSQCFDTNVVNSRVTSDSPTNNLSDSPTNILCNTIVHQDVNSRVTSDSPMYTIINNRRKSEKEDSSKSVCLSASFVSPLPSNEDQPSFEQLHNSKLSAKAKAENFIKQINFLNKQDGLGFLLGNNDINSAFNFFKDYPDKSAADPITTLIEASGFCFNAPSTSGYDNLFHLKKAHVVNYMFKFYDKVQAQLNELKNQYGIQ